MNGSPEITLTLMKEAKSIPGLCKLPHDNHEAGHHMMWCGGKHHTTRGFFGFDFEEVEGIGLCGLEGPDTLAFFLNKLSINFFFLSLEYD